MTPKTPNTALQLSAAFEPPSVRIVGPDRAGETDPVDWDEVDRVVQLHLHDLHRTLAQQWLKCRAEYGRSHGRIFPLYSHASFDDPTAPQKLAIVVGLNFEYGVNSETLNIRAEMVREEVGDILYQEIATGVPNRNPEVFAKTQELGRRLCDCHALIATALELSPSDVDMAS